MARGQNPWFTLPAEAEKTLSDLVEEYGVARILAVLSRFQMPRDRRAEAEKLLRDAGL
jgi:hypothetical protein